jgi:IS5 family transposase
MLRIHCAQLFCNPRDPGVENPFYASDPVRRFVGLKLTGLLPDETTILHFRHLLERHGLGESLLAEINGHLESQGLKLREGAMVDATIVAASSSTRNRPGERAPEMHQTGKGNQRGLGMKAHVGGALNWG